MKISGLLIPVMFITGTVFAKDLQMSNVSQNTLNICSKLAKQAETTALGKIQVLSGSFENDESEEIPKGCSFAASLKPEQKYVLDIDSNRDWDSLSEYMADGPDGGSYARHNGDTVCFVSFHQESLDDDATEDEVKKWKPKPGKLLVGCTDVGTFNKMDHGFARGVDRSGFGVHADAAQVTVSLTDSQGRRAEWGSGQVVNPEKDNYQLKVTGLKEGSFQIGIRLRTPDGVIKSLKTFEDKIKMGQMLGYSLIYDPAVGIIQIKRNN